MRFMDMLDNDEELQALKEQYQQIYNKVAPPFCIDTHGSIQAYKDDIKNRIRKLKET